MRPVWASSGICLMIAISANADGGNSIPAVWKKQHVEFFYMGRTSRYTCDGLRDKMHAILLDMGARRDLRITSIGCGESGLRLRFSGPGPSLDIVFSSPTLPEATVKPRHPGDLAAVDARFEAFTITSDAFRNMEIGDCELVEEFSHQILPKLATRDVKQNVDCVPYEPGVSRYWIRGEVLKPVPRGEQAAGRENPTAP